MARTKTNKKINNKISELDKSVKSDESGKSKCKNKLNEVTVNKINLKDSDDVWNDDVDNDDISDDFEDDHDGSYERKRKMFCEDIGLSAAEVKKLKQMQSSSAKSEKKSRVSIYTAAAKKTHPSVEIIVFQDPALRSKKKKEAEGEVSQKNADSATQFTGAEIDLKKARQEVHRFGLKGLDGKDKESAMIDLLIKLGAKAPKNKYVNYKDFIEQKKGEKDKLQKLKSSRQFMDEGKIKALQSFHTYQKKLQNKDGDVGPVDGRHVSVHGVKVKARDANRMTSRGPDQGGNRRGSRVKR